MAKLLPDVLSYSFQYISPLVKPSSWKTLSLSFAFLSVVLVCMINMCFAKFFCSQLSAFFCSYLCIIKSSMELFSKNVFQHVTDLSGKETLARVTGNCSSYILRAAFCAEIFYH